MPLFDLFKKSPNKKTPTKPSKMSDSFFSSEMDKKRYDAAMEFLKIFQERMPLLGGEPHAGTVLSIAGRLAGTSLYRSLNYKFSDVPGIFVLSEEVNQAYPQLLNLFAFYCKKSGIDVMAKPMVTEFPEKDKPLMDVKQVLLEYQDKYHEIMKKQGLDYLDGARAGMIVCSIVFQYHCATHKDIDPYVATGIIARGVIEGAKITPPPLGSKGSLKSNPVGAEKPKEVTNRLVLGERDVAIQEALDNGGIFIDPGTEVLAALKQNNIDPYLIYEKAVHNQLEEKIPTIDFVKVDVDKLFEEWRWKSYTQAPIHVRLIIWLKNNASTYEYEQKGNSWILKK
jgi:hypothetical protein